MARCAYCAKEELLPFTCSYCKQKFCGEHRLPEKHSCTGLTKEKWLSKKQGEIKMVDRHPYKKAYEVPGVMEVLHRPGASGKESGPEHFDVDEKIVAALILLLILVLGTLSRVF